MLNKYLHGFREPVEQELLQELNTEIIQIYGMDVYYLPRTIQNLNTVLGEDTTSVFENVYTIEMFPENVDGFEGDKNFLSNLGLNIAKTMNLIVSDERFKEEISKGPFNIPNPHIDLNVYETIRPLEGDLIFFPLTKGLFEIKFVDHESPDFYQLGKIYKWRITMEMFKYSNEVIDTGIPEIDQIATQFVNDNSIDNDPLADNIELQSEVDDLLVTEDFDEGSFQGGVFNQMFTVTHAFVSSRPDGIDSTVVQPSNWNADHIISGSSVNQVRYSSTPEFDCSIGDIQTIVLTGNATATVINPYAGQIIIFDIIQGSGSFTFAWPANVHGGLTIGVTAGKHNTQVFYCPDATTLYALSTGVTNI